MTVSPTLAPARKVADTLSAHNPDMLRIEVWQSVGVMNMAGRPTTVCLLLSDAPPDISSLGENVTVQTLREEAAERNIKQLTGGSRASWPVVERAPWRVYKTEGNTVVASAPMANYAAAIAHYTALGGPEGTRAAIINGQPHFVGATEAQMKKAWNSLHITPTWESLVFPDP